MGKSTVKKHLLQRSPESAAFLWVFRHPTTARHFKTLHSEHLMSSATVARYLGACCGTQVYDTSILKRRKDLVILENLEALYIENFKPSLNSKEEYSRCSLAIFTNSEGWQKKLENMPSPLGNMLFF